MSLRHTPPCFVTLSKLNRKEFNGGLFDFPVLFRIARSVVYLSRIMTPNTTVGHVEKVSVMAAPPRPVLSLNVAGGLRLCECVTVAMTTGAFS